MKICLTNKYGTWQSVGTGKGYFAVRLIGAMKKFGGTVTYDPGEKMDIDLQFGKYVYEPVNARASIIRMGPPHIDKHYMKQNKLKRIAIKRADGFIYQSHYGMRMCDVFIGPFQRGPKTVIHNGAVPMQTDSKVGKLFVASTRKWARQKRLKHILRAFLLADIPDAKMVVMGETKQNIDDRRIVYLGPCNRDTIDNNLKKADVLVSVVWLDCMPNSVCEALCAGCKVITASESGVPEIAPDLVLKENEWDFKPCDGNKPPGLDENALAELMRKSLTMPKPYFGHVDIDFIAKQYIDFFGEVLDGRS